MGKKADDITLMLLKLEAAEKLNLVDKVKKVGWGGLTAEETGRIGGYITKEIMKNSKKVDDTKDT